MASSGPPRHPCVNRIGAWPYTCEVMERLYAPSVPDARTTVLPWVLALLLAALVFYAPALVAQSLTAPERSVDFRVRPWQGWAFLGRVLHGGVTGEVPTPGEALSRAAREWDGASGPSATATRLAWAPGGESLTIQPLGHDAAVSVDPPRALAWIVEGRAGSGGPAAVIGILDLQDGKTVWDVRRDLPDAEPRAASADDAPTATPASRSATRKAPR